MWPYRSTTGTGTSQSAYDPLTVDTTAARARLLAEYEQQQQQILQAQPGYNAEYQQQQYLMMQQQQLQHQQLLQARIQQEEEQQKRKQSLLQQDVRSKDVERQRRKEEEQRQFELKRQEEQQRLLQIQEQRRQQQLQEQLMQQQMLASQQNQILAEQQRQRQMQEQLALQQRLAQEQFALQQQKMAQEMQMKQMQQQQQQMLAASAGARAQGYPGPVPGFVQSGNSVGMAQGKSSSSKPGGPDLRPGLGFRPPSPRDRDRDRRRSPRRSPPRRSPKRRSRSPDRRRAAERRAAVERRVVERRPPPKPYLVKLSRFSWNALERDPTEVRARYPSMYVPQDFTKAFGTWIQTFTSDRRLCITRPTPFFIEDCKPEDVVIPSSSQSVSLCPTASVKFNAKVMLMSGVTPKDPDAKDRERDHHLSLQLRFLVGRKSSAIQCLGGPWDAEKDGGDPAVDQSVLVHTAIRTVQEQSLIDLSLCSSWRKFMEIRYYRPAETYHGQDIPAHEEVTVVFVPDIWNVVPTMEQCLSTWEEVQARKKAEKAAKEKAAKEKEDEAKEKAEKEKEKKEEAKEKEGESKDEKADEKAGVEGKSPVPKAEVTAEEKEKQEKLELAKKKLLADVEQSLTSPSKEKEKEKEKDSKDKESSKDKTREKDRERVKEDKPPEVPSVFAFCDRAKGSKFDLKVISLDGLLDYSMEDVSEKTFEVSLFAEEFSEMLQRDFGTAILQALLRAPETFMSKRKRDDEEDDDRKRRDKRRSRDRGEDKKSGHDRDAAAKKDSGGDSAKTKEGTPAAGDDGDGVGTAADAAGAGDENGKQDAAPAPLVPEDTEGAADGEKPAADAEMSEAQPADALEATEPAAEEAPATEATEATEAAEPAAEGEAAAPEEEATANGEVQPMEDAAPTQEETPAETQEANGVTAEEAPAGGEEAAQEEQPAEEPQPEKSKKTVFPELLTAFRFFDRNDLGHLLASDVEQIIHLLGLGLSKRYVHDLVAKVTERGRVKYRTLTDLEVIGDNVIDYSGTLVPRATLLSAPALPVPTSFDADKVTDTSAASQSAGNDVSWVNLSNLETRLSAAEESRRQSEARSATAAKQVKEIKEQLKDVEQARDDHLAAKEKVQAALEKAKADLKQSEEAQAALKQSVEAAKTALGKVSDSVAEATKVVTSALEPKEKAVDVKKEPTA